MIKKLEADMENVRNFTRAGLFISRLYPKVRELRQFQNCDKTENTMFTIFTSLHHVYLINPKKTTNKTQQQSQIGAWLR